MPAAVAFGAVALACALLAGLLGVPAADAQPADQAPATEEVAEAARAVESAEARLQRLSDALDATVEAYERARAHHERLRAELPAAERAEERAEQAVAAAEQALSREVAAAYRRASPQELLIAAIFDAPDSATALHRAGLVRQVADRRAADVADARAEVTEVADATRQHRIIEGGVDGAAAAARERAGELAAALGAAREELTAAEEDLDAAEQRAAASQRRVRTAALGGQPLPAVDGKTCPVAPPHGFSDTWLAPRSGGRQHHGVDIFAAHGTTLYAVADGHVRRVFTGRLGGLSVDLVDDNGDRYYYAHLSAVAVRDGQRVRAGEPVGAVGNTGNARTTPPHLHWQVHPGDGPPVNPYPLARMLCRPLSAP